MSWSNFFVRLVGAMVLAWSIPVLTMPTVRVMAMAIVLPSTFVIVVPPRSGESGQEIELGGIGGNSGLLVLLWSRFSGTGAMGVRWCWCD